MIVLLTLAIFFIRTISFYTIIHVSLHYVIKNGMFQYARTIFLLK